MMFKKIMYVLAVVAVALALPELNPLVGLLLFAGAVTMVDGTRATDDVPAVRLKVDMDDVSLLNPNASPFIALMTRLNKRNAINPKFYHIERKLPPRWDAIDNSGGYTSTETTLTVDNYGYFTNGDVIKVPRTGEVILVGVVTTTLAVTRGVGETSKAALLDNEPLQIIGNASAEGASKRDLKTTKGVEVFNYTQIFRLSFGVTNTEDNSEMFGGNDLNMIRKEHGIVHAIDLERAAWFGERAIDTSGKPKRYTRGLIRFIESAGSGRIVNAGGALTETEWEEFLRVSVINDPDATRVVFASPLVMSVISGWARGKLKLVPTDKTYGIHVVKYISPNGDFNLIQERLFTGTIYGGYAVAVVMKDCIYRPLQTRDTKLNTNIQTPGDDAREEEYLTEAGFQWKHAEKHTVLKGVTE